MLDRDYGIGRVKMNDIFLNTFKWIKDDYINYPLRFIIELLAWGISIGCSITMALTAPHPPLIVLYPIWISGCCLYGWAAYSRKSFGMLANYGLLVPIDSRGLASMLWI